MTSPQHPDTRQDADGPRLTAKQRSWMQAHADFGRPVSMGWLDANLQPVTGAPDTWIYLSARWKNGSVRRLHTDERAALTGYFDPGAWSLTDLGRAALAKASA